MNSKQLRVLVIDNEPLVADSLVQVLNLFGYKALSLHSPNKAIEHISTEHCDLLVSDVVMEPEMSGIDLALEFGKLLPNCKVLLMSGNTLTADLLKEAEKKGHFFDVLPKPVHPEIILDHLKSLAAAAPN